MKIHARLMRMTSSATSRARGASLVELDLLGGMTRPHGEIGHDAVHAAVDPEGLGQLGQDDAPGAAPEPPVRWARGARRYRWLRLRHG